MSENVKPQQDSTVSYKPQMESPAGFMLRAVTSVLAERERELLQVKGPCSFKECRLHYAHSGPCDVSEASL